MRVQAARIQLSAAFESPGTFDMSASFQRSLAISRKKRKTRLSSST